LIGVEVVTTVGDIAKNSFEFGDGMVLEKEPTVVDASDLLWLELVAIQYSVHNVKISNFSKMIAVLVTERCARKQGKNVVSMCGKLLDETSRMGLEISLNCWHRTRALWS
jgi:hypothetical protein